MAGVSTERVPQMVSKAVYSGEKADPVAFDTIEDCLSESEYPAVRPHW